MTPIYVIERKFSDPSKDQTWVPAVGFYFLLEQAEGRALFEQACSGGMFNYRIRKYVPCSEEEQ